MISSLSSDSIVSWAPLTKKDEDQDINVIAPSLMSDLKPVNAREAFFYDMSNIDLLIFDPAGDESMQIDETREAKSAKMIHAIYVKHVLANRTSGIRYGGQYDTSCDCCGSIDNPTGKWYKIKSNEWFTIPFEVDDTPGVDKKHLLCKRCYDLLYVYVTRKIKRYNTPEERDEKKFRASEALLHIKMIYQNILLIKETMSETKKKPSCARQIKNTCDCCQITKRGQWKQLNADRYNIPIKKQILCASCFTIYNQFINGAFNGYAYARNIDFFKKQADRFLKDSNNQDEGVIRIKQEYQT